MITSYPDTTAKMPLLRRRRGLAKLSSSPATTSTVECQGTAYLCFPDDHSWFQGSISTEDESNYSLRGERVVVSDDEKAEAAAAVAERIRKISLTESDEENNNAGEDPNGNIEGVGPNDEPVLEDYYRVTMFDHFTGEKHLLPRIYAKRQDTSASPGQLFTSANGEVTFQVDQVYKGQKADIMIQKYVGSPAHLGTKCLLYEGQINVLFNETIDFGRSWSL